jgi:hypothetical protein
VRGFICGSFAISRFGILFHVFPLLLSGFGGAIVSARAFHLRYRGVQIQLGTTYDCHVKDLANALPKVVGFLRVLRFPPMGNVDRIGWNLLLRDGESKGG